MFKSAILMEPVCKRAFTSLQLATASPEKVQATPQVDKTNYSLAHRKLKEQLTNVYLTNPFRSEFRLLDYFEKLGTSMTISELDYLKTKTGLENRYKICKTLMQLHYDKHIVLSVQQIRFVERMNASFCDRSIQVSKSGELLVYSCIFIRRTKRSKEIGGMLYLHLFIDMFNGFAFGAFSEHPSPSEGVALLKEQVLPVYRTNNSRVNTVWYATKISRDIQEEQELKIAEQALNHGVQWKHTNRTIGTVQQFQRAFLRDLSDETQAAGLQIASLASTVEQWFSTYNSRQSFFQHRDMLQYIDE